MRPEEAARANPQKGLCDLLMRLDFRVQTMAEGGDSGKGFISLGISMWILTWKVIHKEEVTREESTSSK